MGTKLSRAANSSFKAVPAGSHLAVCDAVIDLGTQINEYQGETKRQHQILIRWQVGSERTDDDKPCSIARFYTFSGHEKSNLRLDLEAWRGKAFTDEEIEGFEVARLLGAGAMLNVVEGKNGKTKVSSVGKLPKGMGPPEAEGGTTHLSLTSGEFSQETYDGLSDGLKAIIAKSPEFQELDVADGSVEYIEEDDEESTPF